MYICNHLVNMIKVENIHTFFFENFENCTKLLSVSTERNLRYMFWTSTEGPSNNDQSNRPVCGFFCSGFRSPLSPLFALRKHAYSNILKSSLPKTESFQIKILIFFIFLLKNIDCGYSLEPPGEAVLTSTHNL